MRKFYLNYFLLSLLLLMINNQAYAQQNVTQLGRWGKGHCEAIFRRGGYTFVGNGSYLEVYQTQVGEIEKIDALLLPGLVKDIWVRSDTANIYVACGSRGFILVRFDTRKLFAPFFTSPATSSVYFNAPITGIIATALNAAEPHRRW